MTTFITLGTILMIGITADSWHPVNDNVMGGISSGMMIQTDNGLNFRGTLSLENNGGFSSVRHRVTRNLSDSTGVRLTLKGDGRTYQFRIRQDRNFDGIAWRKEFQTDGSVQTLEMNYEDFMPVWRGRQVKGAGTIDAGEITQLGFMIADKQPGDFSLSIFKLEFLR
jgi:monofunctional biosynthetic peptidoglycan transglycosylase